MFIGFRVVIIVYEKFNSFRFKESISIYTRRLLLQKNDAIYPYLTIHLLPLLRYYNMVL